MKITLSLKAKQMASALLTVLVLGGIICIFIVYYLSLVDQQNKLGSRSQGWNLAIAVSEAGIEDALEELNSTSTPLASDGWIANGSVYWRTNVVGPNGNCYTVSLDETSTSNPVITSRAYINLPALARAPLSYFFATVGSGSGGSVVVSRAIRVTCSKPNNLFTAAMVSKHAIDLKGNGVLADSFDSSSPAKSTSGKYDSSKYTGDRGDVATDDSIIVGVQNANIYGKLHTGPNGGYSMGPQGGVGTHAWQGANGGGMQPGYFLQDANFTFPDTTLPNTSGYLTPQPGTIVVTTYNVTSNTVTQGTPPSPPPAGGLTTNVVSYTTVPTLPNPIPPGMITNTSTVTTSTYPSPVPPGGVTTNITGYTTVSSQPSPAPAGLTTNTAWVNNSTTLPSPVPAGTQTNTTYTSSLTYPSPGTYVGGVTTNIVTSGPKDGRGTWYNYNLISSYNYPTYTYTYPSSFSYSYAGYTYTYPNYTYSYGVFQTNAVYTTNYYDNVLYPNNKYVSSALNGNSIVMGPNVNLVLPNGLSGAENLLFNYNDNSDPGLTIWAGGTSASISGNQYINPCGFAGSLIVYCAPSVTSFTLNGNGQFTGVLVAPFADIAMHGGGNSNEDFCGSLMVNSVSMNGHFQFHWDEALGRMAGNNTRYLINSWNEIP